MTRPIHAMHGFMCDSERTDAFSVEMEDSSAPCPCCITQDYTPARIFDFVIPYFGTTVEHRLGSVLDVLTGNVFFSIDLVDGVLNCLYFCVSCRA